MSLQTGISSLDRIYELFKETDEDITDKGKNFNPNDKVMIKGKNRSGKTTFLKLLLGLYKVNNESIYINDIDINKYSKKSLRKKISVVSQKIILFEGTIYDNVIFSLDNYDTNRVNEVLEMCGVQNIIDDNTDNKIGENAKLLSGGQILK